MLERTRDWEALRDGFRWDIPDRLNMAAQVCDDWAEASFYMLGTIDEARQREDARRAEAA